MKDELSYEDWKNDIEIWSDITDLHKTKQGGAVFLTLKGKAQATVRSGVTRDEMRAADGLQKITECLDKLYLKDSTRKSLSAFEHFVKFKRDVNMSIEDYLVEFNIRYSKCKRLDMTLPEGVLAYYLLECSSLTEEQKNICRATCDELTFENMKEKIGRVTCDRKPIPEPVFYEGYPEEYHYEDYYQDDNEYFEHETNDEDGADHIEEKTFYAPTRGAKSGSYRHPNFNTNPRMNTPDEYGNPTKCGFCKSIYHYISACPDAKAQSQSKMGYQHKRGMGRGRFSRGNQRGFGSRQQNQYI